MATKVSSLVNILLSRGFIVKNTKAQRGGAGSLWKLAFEQPEEKEGDEAENAVNECEESNDRKQAPVATPRVVQARKEFASQYWGSVVNPFTAQYPAQASRHDISFARVPEGAEVQYLAQ